MFFVGSDHLGSTAVLTCHKQPTATACTDRAIYRFYRYDAYGNIKAHDANGSLRTTWNEPTERLYTGQIWDPVIGIHYYKARFYEPKLAVFATTDAAREYANPYAYVQWRPTSLNDPTGNFSEAVAVTAYQMGVAACGSECGNPDAAGRLAAEGYAGQSGAGGTSGTMNVGTLGGSIAAKIEAVLKGGSAPDATPPPPPPGPQPMPAPTGTLDSANKKTASQGTTNASPVAGRTPTATPTLRNLPVTPNATPAHHEVDIATYHHGLFLAAGEGIAGAAYGIGKGGMILMRVGSPATKVGGAAIYTLSVGLYGVAGWVASHDQIVIDAGAMLNGTGNQAEPEK